MTQLTQTAAAPASPRLAVFALVAAQFALMMGALAVLAPAINWPASLSLPAAQVLALIRAQAGAVALGYSLYFASAFLLIPLALLLRRQLRTGAGSALSDLTAQLGVLAGVLKLFGILRWLVAMPALAGLYASGDGATRSAALVAYEALNRYAGGVGELLGVQLFAGLWTVLVSALLWRAPRARWLGAGGLLAGALLLVGVLGVFGVSLGPILLLQGVAWQLWLLALGLSVLRAR